MRTTFLPTVFLRCVWDAAKAAFWTTVHISYSTSYLSFSLGTLFACIAIFPLLRQSKPAGQRGSDMLTCWFRNVWTQMDGPHRATLAIGVIFLLAPFVINFWKAMRVFVLNRPEVQITWEQPNGFEPMPFMDLSEVGNSYFVDHRQYVFTIKYPKGNVIPASLSLLFQFPFPVDRWVIMPSGGTAAASFVPKSLSSPVLLNKRNLEMHGQPHYLNWILTEPTIKPGGEFRLVLILNSNAQSPVASWSQSPQAPAPPLSVRATNLISPFVYVSTGVTFGNESGEMVTYASFQVDQNSVVSLGKFEIPPKPLPLMEQVF